MKILIVRESGERKEIEIGEATKLPVAAKWKNRGPEVSQLQTLDEPPAAEAKALPLLRTVFQDLSISKVGFIG